MKAICVDDEKLILEETVAVCRELPQIEQVEGFTRAKDALLWLETNQTDLALLDIDMPGMTGIQLAARIKQKYPDTAIIFLTSYSEYAVDAFAVRASGYLLKPLDKKRLEEDVDFALSRLSSAGEGRLKRDPAHIEVKTFGSFDVYVDGKPVHFKMAKCKELLAYLVDKQGSGVSRKEIFLALWEDREYDRKMQKQLDVYIRRLRQTLREYDIDNIFDMEKGILRICPEQFSCDAYLFFAGDSDAVNAYRGEYMISYSWASITESTMYWKLTEKA